MLYSRQLTGLVLIIFFLATSVSGQPLKTADGIQPDYPQEENSSDARMIYTLPDCITRSLMVNPKIKAAEFNVKKAESEIGNQRSNFFPTLSAQTYAEQIQSINAKGPTDQDYIGQDINVLNFRLSQTLFQGFTIFNTYQQSILNKALAQAQKKQVEMDLILEVQTNFFKFLKAKEDARSYEASVHRLEVNRKAIHSFYEKKMAPHLSVLQAEVELANARQLLSKAKNEVRTQKVALNILLGFSAEKQIEYAGNLSTEISDFDMDMIACLDSAYKNRTEMEIANISLEMGQKELAIQDGQFSPKITASADYYIRNNWYDNKGVLSNGELYDRDQQNTYWTAMIQLQWNFNLGGREFYQRAKAVHDLARLKENRQSTQDLISKQVQVYFTTLSEAREQIAFSQTSLQSAREAYESAQKRYQLQLGTIYELLDIQARLTRAEANYNQAIADYRLSLANLFYAIGKCPLRPMENQPLDKQP